MRMKQLAVGIVAAFAALLLPAAFLSPVSAAPAASSSDTFRAGSSVAGAPDAKAGKRNVTIRFVGGDGSFGLVGQVGPAKKSKRITTLLQYSRTRNGNYTRYRSERTDGRARYAYTGLRKPGWFRVVAPKSRGLGTGVSKKIKVTRS